MSNILVVTEVHDGQLKSINMEVFSMALQLGAETNQTVTALVAGTNAGAVAAQAGAYGIETAIAVEDDKLAKFSPDCFAAAVAGTVKAKGFSTVLMGATYTGKDIMARVSQILDAGLAQDCTAHRVDGDQIVFTRPMNAGKVFADVKVSGEIVLASIRPKAYKAAEKAVTTAVEALSLDLPTPIAVVEKVHSSGSGKLDLNEADIIVSGGRGMKGAEHWGILEDLATTLGAATGCSRPVSDEGWRPHEEHIGQTGRTVSPNLYIACGISGAIQHIAGISSSNYILAINKDPEAPIFKVADYGIVGDVFEVLPAMNEAVKALKG